MLRRTVVLSFMAITALLTGCAGVSQQAYTRSTAQPLKKVILVTQTEPPKIGVGIGGSIGLMFGGIGAGIAAANAGAQAKTLDQLLTSEGLNYHQRLQDKIVTSLNRAGVQTELIAVSRPRIIDFVEDYKPLLSKYQADAILDLIVVEASYGGTHPLLDPKPRPILKARAKLVSAKDFSLLYGDAISYGYSNPFESAKELKAPKEYYFDSIEQVGAEKKRAADGLAVAVDEVAHYLTQQFLPSSAMARNP